MAISAIIIGSMFLIKTNHKKSKSILTLRTAPITLYSQPEAPKIFKLNDSYRPLFYIKRNNYIEKNDCIIDPATALMWQKNRESKPMRFHHANTYIDELNDMQYLGFRNWRLPTVEELSSLIEPEKINNLYIDPVFRHIKGSYWSIDTLAVKTPFGSRTNAAWGVDFRFGYIFWSYLEAENFVRGVRSTE